MRKIIGTVLSLIFFSSVIFAGQVEKAIQKLQKKETRQEAIMEIEKIGKSVAPQLRQLAKDKEKDQDSRVSAIILLGKLKDGESEIDLENLLEKDEDKFCREASAISLGNLNDKKAIPKLKQALKDESGNVRMRAVWALAKMGDKSGKQLALDTIQKEKDATHKLLAAEALGEIGDKDIIPELEENFKSSDIRTRWYSKVAIKKIGMANMDEQSRIKYLEKILNSDEMNNWSAVELVKIGTAEAINALKETAKNAKNPGSGSAYKVLEKLVEQGKLPKEELQK